MTINRKSRITTVLAVVAVGLGAAGCGAGPESDSSTSSTRTSIPAAMTWTPPVRTEVPRSRASAATTLPAGTDVDRDDPAAVAAAAVAIWFEWDTVADSGPIDASGRAAPLLTAELAADVTGSAPITGPGLDWQEWADRHARLVPSVRPGAETTPPATENTAYAQFVVDQAVTEPDGTVTGHLSTVVDVTLTRGLAGWEVAAVDIR